jgi:glycosyltransferase involved in cell wall biosynthesis
MSDQFGWDSGAHNHLRTINQMKLIIQIPCYNEADSIGSTIRQLPRKLPGISKIEVLVIDDGSQDQTINKVIKSGVTHVLKMEQHVGLARAYAAGLNECIRLKADLIVNTDADNQYNAGDIAKLIQPILKGEAGLVVGDRGVLRVKEFSLMKRLLQKVGSMIVGWAAGMKIPDATSGFRALSREAALRTNVFSNYSYTLETLIQAGVNGIPVTYVPISVNPPTRPSRLMRGTTDYLYQSGATIIRVFSMYRPLKVFSIVSGILVLAGVILGIRYLFYYFQGSGSGHVQSVILAAILIIVGFQTFLIGLVADLISANRKLEEEILYRLKKGK